MAWSGEEPLDITFCGTVYDCTGYGVISRGYAHALHRLGHNVRVIPYHAVPGHRHQFPGNDTLRSLQNTSVAPELNFQCSHPIWNPGFRRRIISLTFEGSRLPYPDWIHQLNPFDLVVVPCRQNAEVLRTNGLGTKLLVEGYGVDLAPALPKPDLSQSPFTFVSVFTWVPRKNIQAMARAYAEEFPDNGKTRLLLKTFILNATPPEYHRIRQEIAAWTGIRNDIIVLEHPYEQIRELLNQCHAYVCTSLDEGFYLPAAESLMCGLPVISVRFGGQLEYLSDANSYLVDYELRDGYAWVKHEALRAAMRHVYEHFDEASARALAGRETVLATCDWDRITDRILRELP